LGREFEVIFCSEGQGWFQLEISPEPGIFNREGRERSTKGSAEPERLTQGHEAAA